MILDRRGFLAAVGLAAGGYRLTAPALTSTPSARDQLTAAAAAAATARLSTLGIWQLPWRGGAQSMGYRVTTGSYTIAIDGGMPHDATAFAAAIGRRVDAWIVTHPHPDHVGALIEILNKRRDISIGAVYADLPSVEWVRQHEPAYLPDLVALLAAFRGRGITVTPLHLGQRLNLGGLRVDVLGVGDPEITVNALNNSSLVLRVQGNNRAVLFLADLGVEGGRKLLAGPTAHLLPSDTVQMAHHGNNGVARDVYAAIGARTYMWPTPRWLWDNDSGGGVGSGPWDTLTVRRWTTELTSGTARHVLAWRGAEGDQLA